MSNLVKNVSESVKSEGYSDIKVPALNDMPETKKSFKDIQQGPTKMDLSIEIFKELFDENTVKGTDERKANSSLIINAMCDRLGIKKPHARSYLNTIRKKLGVDY